MTANDNLGILLAGLFRPLSTGNKSVFGIINTAGASHEMVVYGDPSANNVFNEAGASRAQVGKGTTPPTRQDRNIESPFTNGGVEDSAQSSNLFGYNSGLAKITIATQINPTTGA